MGGGSPAPLALRQIYSKFTARLSASAIIEAVAGGCRREGPDMEEEIRVGVAEPWLPP
jgi:hypothetical protein